MQAIVPSFPVAAFTDEVEPTVFSSWHALRREIEHWALPNTVLIDSEGRVFEVVEAPDEGVWSRLLSAVGVRRRFATVSSKRAPSAAQFELARAALEARQAESGESP